MPRLPAVPLRPLWLFCVGFSAPNRRLVFRPSTRAEVAYIFSRLEHHRWSNLSRLRHLAIDLFKIFLHPSHARHFNLAILRDPEDGGNIGQPVGIRSRIRS